MNWLTNPVPDEEYLPPPIEGAAEGFAAILKLSVKDEASGKVSNPDLESEHLAAVRPILNQCAERLAKSIREKQHVGCIVMAGRIGLKHPEIIEALQGCQSSEDMNVKLNAICSLLFLEGIELDEQGKRELMGRAWWRFQRKEEQEKLLEDS